jgi:hypothetical protein
MNDPFVIALAGGGLAILGVIVGQLISYITEGRKRSWQLEDKDKDWGRKIRNMRLDQVETFVERLSVEFNHERVDIFSGTTETTTQESANWIIHNAYERFFVKTDNKDDLQDPIVESIGDKELLASWKSIRATSKESNLIMLDFLNHVKDKDIPVKDEERKKYKLSLDTNQAEFLKNLVDIYKQIDRVRSL